MTATYEQVDCFGDEQDWPLLALALTLDCPVWTEDKDFFGTGVATWHTQTVEIYLRQ